MDEASSSLHLPMFCDEPTASHWFNEHVDVFNNIRWDQEEFKSNETLRQMLVPKLTVKLVTVDEDAGTFRFDTPNMTVSLVWLAWFTTMESLRPSAEHLRKDARLLQELDVSVLLPQEPHVPSRAAASLGYFSKMSNQDVFSVFLKRTHSVLTGLNSVPARCSLEHAEKTINKAFVTILRSLLGTYPGLKVVQCMKTLPEVPVDKMEWKEVTGLGSDVLKDILSRPWVVGWLEEALIGALLDLDHVPSGTATMLKNLKSVMYVVQPTQTQPNQLKQVSSSTQLELSVAVLFANRTHSSLPCPSDARLPSATFCSRSVRQQNACILAVSIRR